MKKVIIIVPSVIVGLIVILLVLMSLTNQNAPEGKNTFVRSVYLERIPAGTQFNPEVKGVFSTTFKKDDQMALNGEADFMGKASLTVKIAKEGEVEQKDAMPAMTLKPGSFGFCCLTVPTEIGKYYLHIYTNDKEEAVSPISFEVVE